MINESKNATRLKSLLDFTKSHENHNLSGLCQKGELHFSALKAWGSVPQAAKVLKQFIFEKVNIVKLSQSRKSTYETAPCTFL